MAPIRMRVRKNKTLIAATAASGMGTVINLKTDSDVMAELVAICLWVIYPYEPARTLRGLDCDRWVVVELFFSYCAYF